MIFVLFSVVTVAIYFTCLSSGAFFYLENYTYFSFKVGTPTALPTHIDEVQLISTLSISSVNFHTAKSFLSRNHISEVNLPQICQAYFQQVGVKNFKPAPEKTFWFNNKKNSKASNIYISCSDKECYISEFNSEKLFQKNLVKPRLALKEEFFLVKQTFKDLLLNQSYSFQLFFNCYNGNFHISEFLNSSKSFLEFIQASLAVGKNFTLSLVSEPSIPINTSIFAVAKVAKAKITNDYADTSGNSTIKAFALKKVYKDDFCPNTLQIWRPNSFLKTDLTETSELSSIHTVITDNLPVKLQRLKKNYFHANLNSVIAVSGEKLTSSFIFTFVIIFFLIPLLFLWLIWIFTFVSLKFLRLCLTGNNSNYLSVEDEFFSLMANIFLLNSEEVKSYLELFKSILGQQLEESFYELSDESLEKRYEVLKAKMNLYDTSEEIHCDSIKRSKGSFQENLSLDNCASLDIPSFKDHQSCPPLKEIIVTKLKQKYDYNLQLDEICFFFTEIFNKSVVTKEEIIFIYEVIKIIMETANSFILRNYKDLSTYKLCKNEISIKDPKKFGNLLRIENENLLRKLEKKDDALISLRRGYEELKINFEKKSEEVIILQNNIREKVINLQASSNQLEQTQLLVDRLEADLEAATARPSLYTSEESQKKKVEEFEILLKQKENEIVELKEELENLIRKTNAQSKNLSELSSFIDNLNDQINKKNNEVDELTVNLTLQRKKLSELNGVVENLETQLHQRDTDLENLQLCSNEKAEEIRLLNEKLQQRDEDFHNLAISRQSIKSQLRDKEIEVNEIKQLTEKFSGLTSKVKKEQLTEKEKDNLIKKEIIDLEKVSSTVTSEVEIYSFDNSSKDLVIDIFKDQQSSYEKLIDKEITVNFNLGSAVEQRDDVELLANEIREIKKMCKLLEQENERLIRVNKKNYQFKAETISTEKDESVLEGICKDAVQFNTSTLESLKQKPTGANYQPKGNQLYSKNNKENSVSLKKKSKVERNGANDNSKEDCNFLKEVQRENNRGNYRENLQPFLRKENLNNTNNNHFKKIGSNRIDVCKIDPDLGTVSEDEAYSKGSYSSKTVSFDGKDHFISFLL